MVNDVGKYSIHGASGYGSLGFVGLRFKQASLQSIRRFTRPSTNMLKMNMKMQPKISHMKYQTITTLLPLHLHLLLSTSFYPLFRLYHPWIHLLKKRPCHCRVAQRVTRSRGHGSWWHRLTISFAATEDGLQITGLTGKVSKKVATHPWSTGNPLGQLWTQ